MNNPKPTACRHYSVGPGFRPLCAVGLDPAALSVYGDDWPCISSPRAVCARREAYNAEEITASDDAQEAALQRMITCLSVIPRKGANLSEGNVPCPVCGGTIHWLRVGRERHLRAACSTDGCFNVMT